MSCSSWQNYHDAHAHQSILYLTTVPTIQKTSRSFLLSSKLKVLSENLNKLLLLQPAHLTLCTLLTTLCTLHFTLLLMCHSPPHALSLSCLCSFVLSLHPDHFCLLLNFL